MDAPDGTSLFDYNTKVLNLFDKNNKNIKKHCYKFGQ
jgi:hypothetical protein